MGSPFLLKQPPDRRALINPVGARKGEGGGRTEGRSTGPQPLITRSLSTAFSLAQARKGFWDAYSQSSGDKGRVEQAQLQKLAWEHVSPKDSLERDLNNTDRFREKLGPLSAQGKEPPTVPSNLEGMPQQLQEELEKVRARLEPYMAEVHQSVGWNLEALRQKLKPYTTDLMEQVALRVQELQEQLHTVREDTKAQLLGCVDEVQGLLWELQNRIVHHTGRTKALFHPYAERLVPGIQHHVQELQRSMAPHAAGSPAASATACPSHCVPMLSRKLTLKAKALHARIQHNLDHLREELSAFAGAGVSSEEEGTNLDAQVLSQEVCLRLHAFRHDTFHQIAAFTRSIDQETEEVQQQLAPPPPGHSAFAPEFLEVDSSKARSKLQAHLDDLWEDINYSLCDHDLGHLGEP
ncbi:apolipoprotein A-V [Sturnira hondurensis]|uniref:apolipoprotein A-V n=1 Tax=Sturnira hondurensis TaxID=192404 RepID=UPI00187A486E|nr:apolipoprotein A-V [Sturnira hondurensis]